MNKVVLSGRLTKDPEVRYKDDKGVAKYTLAVDRKFAKKDDEVTADFFNCVSFGKQAEFVEKYMRKGTKVILEGQIRNNNYTDKDGKKVYSTEVVVAEIEFAESKKADSKQDEPQAQPDDQFLSIPDGVENDLPFK